MPQAVKQDAFDRRINLILDELGLAIRWQRPCLITSVFRAEPTRNMVQTLLANALKKSGQPVFHYFVSKKHYDVPIELMDQPGHEQKIFFISNLRAGGGRGYSNAYRALNMHREYQIDGRIKAIFWVTELEAEQVARFAPDFWAFRHLVVEFLDSHPPGA